MLNRHKLTHILVLLATFLALMPSRVLACSGFTPSFWDAYNSATAVFTGKIIHIETLGDLKVTFQVLKVWKGPKEEQLVVTTAGSPISCGIPFGEFESDTFLVYAYGTDSQLSTHVFSRTMPLSEADADIMKLIVVTNAILILLVGAAVGFAIIGITRHFLRKRQNRSLADHDASEVRSTPRGSISNG